MTPYPLDKSGNIIQFSKELDEYGSARFRVSAYDTMLTTYGDVLVPHTNWLQIIKGGAVVWQGAIIENTKRTKDYIECIAVEPLWYLSKILVNRTSIDPSTGTSDNIYRIFGVNAAGTSYMGTDLTMKAAVTSIINETISTLQSNSAAHTLSSMTLGTVQNPNYPPNITSGDNPPKSLTGPWYFGNGTNAPMLQFDFHNILYILHQFGVYTYSDFYIDNSLVFSFVQFKGNNLSASVNFTWSQGGQGNTPANIVNYNIPRLGQRQINNLVGIATDINGNVLNYPQSDQASIASYGYLQGVAAYSDVKDQATLNARIQAELPLISVPDDTAISVTQSEKGYPLGTFDVGDIVTINIQNKGVSFNSQRRIVGFTVLVNGTGREMTTIQTNKLQPFQLALANGTGSTSATT